MEHFRSDSKSIIDKFDKPDEKSADQIKKEQIQNIISKFGESIKIDLEHTEPKERVVKLIEAGVLSEIEGYSWGCLGGDRFFVFANIDGVPVPFYKTSARTGGKRQDTDFFPFFGVHTAGQPWLIKGDTEKDTNSFYNNQKLEQASKILTEAFNFDTDRKIKKQAPGRTASSSSGQSAMEILDSYDQLDGYVPDGNEIIGNENLNGLLSRTFGIDFNAVNNLPAYSMKAVALAKSKIIG